jgi:hypothetical protein
LRRCDFSLLPVVFCLLRFVSLKPPRGLEHGGDVLRCFTSGVERTIFTMPRPTRRCVANTTGDDNTATGETAIEKNTTGRDQSAAFGFPL